MPFQTGRHHLRGSQHRTEGLAQPSAFEAWIDDPALAFPGFAVADEDAIAQQVTKRLTNDAGFRELFLLFDQDAPDQRRLVGAELPRGDWVKCNPNP